MKNFLTKTKGNYYHNSKERGIRRYFLWILIAFVVLIIGKDIARGFTASVSMVFYEVREYFMTSSATFPVYLRGRAELLAEIQKLEQQIATQQGIVDTLSQVTDENKELRELLSATNAPRIAAGVIARPPYTPYDTIVLDRGSEEGIVLNAPVFHGQGIALGYVRSVFPHTALVTLFSSPNVETTVYVFGANIFTTAHGEGGGVIRISVPQGVSLEKGKSVVLPSLEGGVLGIIDDIQSISTEPEQHAFVTLGVPLQSVHLVGVGAAPVTGNISYDEAKERVEQTNALFKIDVPEVSEQIEVEVQNATSTTTASTSQHIP